MKKNCLIVRGKKQDDDRFRPGTPTPEKHWAYMLLDSYAEYNEDKCRIEYPNGIGIHWTDDKRDVINVRVSSELWKNNEACFEHLMSFIKQNDLTYEFPSYMNECTNCEGQPSCIANEHAMSDIRVSDSKSETCPHAA